MFTQPTLTAINYYHYSEWFCILFHLADLLANITYHQLSIPESRDPAPTDLTPYLYYILTDNHTTPHSSSMSTPMA